MNAETTQSNDPSLYGKRCPNPWSNRTGRWRRPALRRARDSAIVVGIDPDDLRLGMETLDQQRQVSRPQPISSTRSPAPTAADSTSRR